MWVLLAWRWAAVGRDIGYAPHADMVGHTGDLEAAMSACALVDGCVKELLDTCDKMGGRWLLTADHGNADDMVQRQKKSNEPMMGEDGQPLPLTSHTLVRLLPLWYRLLPCHS